MTGVPTRSLSRRSVLRGSMTIAGAAVALPTFAALGACAPAPPSLDKHAALIAAIAGRIIPATDTPGAIEAGVPGYIGAVFEDHFTEDQKTEFLAGLEAIAGVAQEEGADDFASASADRQDAILAKLAMGGDEVPATAAWRHLHDMTVFGFYTAEAATEELAYEEIPGRQIGCLPFDEIGRAWLDRGV